MRSKAKVLLVVMAYGGSERPELGVWTRMAAAWSATSPLIDDVIHAHIDVCPTPVARNKAVKTAREQGCDIIVSVDADTVPHKGFFQFAVGTLIRCKEPTVIVAPYVCGGGPAPGSEERVQVFRWRTDRTGDPNELARLDHIPREEAAHKSGLEPVACGGTGCFACHTEVFDAIKPPYFDYEYGDPERTVVVATEDVHCFRDLSAAGVQIACAWDYWVEAHWKPKGYGKPAVLHPEEVWGRTKKLLQDRDLLVPDRDPAQDGFFDYPRLYERLVRECRPGGTIVEVGSFTGLSFAHLAKAARARGAGILCVSVDHGLGGGEPGFAALVRKMGGTSAPHLSRRLLAEGLTEEVLQVVGTSAVASRQFADGSLDAVFIDADHHAEAVEADIRAWWPKLRPGGIMAGHDWDRPGVKQGVARAIAGAAQSPDAPSCWVARKDGAPPGVPQEATEAAEAPRAAQVPAKPQARPRSKRKAEAGHGLNGRA